MFSANALVTPAGAGAGDLRVPISDSPCAADEFQQPSLLRQLWFDDQQYLTFKLDLFLSGRVTAMDHFSIWFIALALGYQVYRFILFLSSESVVRVLGSDGSATSLSNAVSNLFIFSNTMLFFSICLCAAWLVLVFSLRSSASLNSLAAGTEPLHRRCLSDFVARVRKLALAWKQSSHRELLYESATLLFPLSVSLQLFSLASAGACAAENTTNALFFCIPAGSTLPSGRVFLVFISPIFAQSIAHVVRVRSVLISWLISCVFVLASALRFGNLPLELVHILSALMCLFIILRMDQFGRECHVVHLRELALQDAARRLELAESRAINARLEIEMLKTEKHVLESSSKEICALMGNVAHDLKTPIQAISTGLELLRSEYALLNNSSEGTSQVSPNYQISAHLSFSSLVESIAAACLFMKANVNRSIEFAKMGSNIALVPKHDTIDLAESLTGPLQVVRITHPTVTIALAPLPSEVCPRVITDKLWLVENALCLLSNAVNYSDGGAISMDISLRALPAQPSLPSLLPSSVSSTSQEALSIVSNSVDLRSPVHHNSAVRPDISLDSGSSLRMLRVTVTDSGIGVSPDVRSKLFQPFQQAQRMAGGSGLGLFSLSERIHALGGRCGVDSRADGARGSSFWFEFPYRPYATDLTDDSSPDELGAPAVSSSLSGSKSDMALVALNEVSVERADLEAHPWAMRRRSMLLQSPSTEPTSNTTPLPLRILLVEDSPFIVKLTTRMLASQGHAVESALNGSTALDRLRAVFGTRDDFDLVLCDFQMPVMDGFECVRRYRQIERSGGDCDAAAPSGAVTATGASTSTASASAAISRPDMVIVGMSANSDIGSQSLAHDAGMDAFLAKPFSGAELQLIISRFG